MTTRHSRPSETAPTREEADRDAQILRHAKLVRTIARRYTGRGLAYDDIVQSGYIGLIQAVDRFDSSRGVPLREIPHVAMPIGGIGTGTVALCSDGSLRQWQLHNIGNHLGALPFSFFAIVSLLAVQ